MSRLGGRRGSGAAARLGRAATLSLRKRCSRGWLLLSLRALDVVRFLYTISTSAVRLWWVVGGGGGSPEQLVHLGHLALSGLRGKEDGRRESSSSSVC